MAEKPVMNTFNALAEVLIQKYERYLPTAFDDSLTLLQKVNKIIEYLNQVGKLTTDVVTQWNEVMEWIVADGINEKVAERLDEMVVDGTFSTIINQTIFNGLNTRVGTLETGVTTINTNIATANGKINTLISDLDTLELSVIRIGKDVKSYGAKGDYVSDSNKGTNDTLAFQTLLNEGGVIFVPKGDYYIASNLNVKSNTRLIFASGATLHTYSDKPFSFGVGVENVRIEQAKLVNHSGSTSYAFYMEGDYSQQYATTVKSIVIEHCMAQGHTWSFYMKNVRKTVISNFHGYTNNGIYYTAKSAENVIKDSNFINFNETLMTGSKGFLSVADGSAYPEGITINATLFYHFERNMHVRDMYVGKFDNLYLDGQLSSCLPNLIEYNVRNEFTTFNNTWALGKGFVLGLDTYTTPKEMRIKFVNTFLDFLVGDGFQLKPWVRAVELINTSYYGDGTATQKSAIVGSNWNDFLIVRGLVARFCNDYVVLFGNGNNIYISDITNFDNKATKGIYNQMAITLDSVAKSAMA